LNIRENYSVYCCSRHIHSVTLSVAYVLAINALCTYFFQDFLTCIWSSADGLSIVPILEKGRGFRTIFNGQWIHVIKWPSRWNSTENTIIFWPRGLMPQNCQSLWTMERVNKKCGTLEETFLQLWLFFWHQPYCRGKMYCIVMVRNFTTSSVQKVQNLEGNFRNWSVSILSEARQIFIALRCITQSGCYW